MSQNHERDEWQYTLSWTWTPRSLMDLPVHVTTQQVISYLDVIGLIHLSATCRTWYAVRRSVLQTKLSVERSAPSIEFAGSEDFSPYRAHRYAFWLSVCPRTLVEAIVDLVGKNCTTDVLEAMIMSGRRKMWPWMDDYHPLVFRDVMFSCGHEIEKIQWALETRTLAYTKLGLLDKPYSDVFFANRVVSTEGEWESFKSEWLAAMAKARYLRLFDGADGYLAASMLHQDAPSVPLPVTKKEGVG